MSTAALTVVVGSPQTVREHIARMRERTGFNILVFILQFGVMPAGEAQHGDIRGGSHAPFPRVE